MTTTEKTETFKQQRITSLTIKMRTCSSVSHH